MAERLLFDETEKEEIDISITPDFLSPESKIEELYEKLYATQGGINLFKDKNLIPQSKRGTRVSLSDWERWIPAVHLILNDDDFNEKTPLKKVTPKKPNLSKYSIIGTALHELSCLTGLINHGKLTGEEIQQAFPTYKLKSLTPYFEALEDAEGQSLFDIWEKFRKHPGLSGLIDEEDQWIIKEFPEIELSDELQLELKIRKGKEVYETGCDLIPFILSDPPSPVSTIYFEVGNIFNWDHLSKDGNTRIQIPNRYDSIYSQNDNRKNIEFSDLKTGPPKLDYTHKFQALLMHFMAGHFIKRCMKNGEIHKDQDGNWLISKSSTILPQRTRYEFSHKHFDATKKTFKTIKTEIDYTDENGQLFLEWLAFYSDAMNALKGEIRSYLQTGVLPQPASKTYQQQSFNLVYKSTQTKKEESSRAIYKLGTSEGKPCPTCNAPMLETCYNLRDLGGPKISFWIEQLCQDGHFRENKQMKNVAREILEY